ncbi:hypothetical protein NQ318_005417 [Aromia moschata]|uniref:Homeobox domain-containing protein n=1 Tax=Aromia moschata TaxID=1265417 RepID=A0AAV8YYN5_9CUCU|nr:hypothetical protein NQ318_005417 [Aromia moschata]
MLTLPEHLYFFIQIFRIPTANRTMREKTTQDGLHGISDKVSGGRVREKQIPVSCQEVPAVEDVKVDRDAEYGLIKIWFQNRRTKWKRKYTNDIEMLAQQYYNSMGILTPRPIFIGDRLWFFNYPGQPGVSGGSPVLPNLVPVPGSAPIMPQAPLSNHRSPCVRNYVEYPAQTEGASETPPIMHLQNFGRHFENS